MTFKTDFHATPTDRIRAFFSGGTVFVSANRASLDSGVTMYLSASQAADLLGQLTKVLREVDLIAKAKADANAGDA